MQTFQKPFSDKQVGLLFTIMFMAEMLLDMDFQKEKGKKENRNAKATIE